MGNSSREGFRGLACRCWSLNITLDLGCSTRSTWTALAAAKCRRRGNPRGIGPCVEERSTDQQQSRTPPAQVERGAELTFVRSRHIGVIEIPDDGMGRPADRYENEEPRDDKEYAGHSCQARLEAWEAHALGALDTQNTQRKCQGADEQSENRQTPGGLHVTRKSQQAVIDLALNLPCALPDAIHPQALPCDLRRYNVVSDEGRDPPHGQGAHQEPAHPAYDGQDQAEQLHAGSCHGESFPRTITWKRPMDGRDRNLRYASTSARNVKLPKWVPMKEERRLTSGPDGRQWGLWSLTPSTVTHLLILHLRSGCRAWPKMP